MGITTTITLPSPAPGIYERPTYHCAHCHSMLHEHTPRIHHDDINQQPAITS